MSFRARKSRRVAVKISNPITGCDLIDIEIEWGDEVGFDYDCHKCGFSGMSTLDNVVAGWFGKEYVHCENCNKKINFEVETEEIE